MYLATRQKVKNRGIPPDHFLDEMVAWGKTAPADIFAPNTAHDVYASVVDTLGPWTSPDHRRAAMLEVMRVLAGFESSWHWDAGVDTSSGQVKNPDNTEAGAWQVSADSMHLAPPLKALVQPRIHTTDGVAFQAAMKQDHALAMEYIARLLRVTVAANGPVKRHEIDPWLSRTAVAEFQSLLQTR
jgi:hypothetical protein